MASADERYGDAPIPVLSVCIPAYNGASFLAESIKSVLDQSFYDFELVVVDDSSTDATVEVAHSFKDPRIRIFANQVNRGLVGNWNRCIELARGAYVCIFHQDDVMMPGNLAKKVGFLDESPTVGFVHSNVLQVGPQGELLSEGWSPRLAAEDVGLHPGAPFLDKLLRGGNAVCAPSVVLRRDCLDAIGPFDGRLPYTADWEMWMRAAVFFDVGYFIEPLLKYRRHQNNETNKFLGSAELEHAYRAKALVLEKCGRYIAGAEQLKIELARQYLEFALWEARISGQKEHYIEAWRYLTAGAGSGTRSQASTEEDVRLQSALTELNRASAEIDVIRKRITAMESSKFWRLRRAWFRAKRALHLPGDE